MIIGIDVREGVRDQRAGKGEYVYQLADNLIKHSQHKFVLFTDAPTPAHWFRPNVRVVRWPSSPLAWQLLTVAYLEFMRSVDVYLSTTSLIVPALARSAPVVTTLFDFVSFIFPDTHKTKAVWWERLFMVPALRYSRHLLAISEHTKQDAVRLFRADPRKITVTPLAPAFTKGQVEISAPDRPTILFVGTLEPRKNLVNLITAFNRLRDEAIDVRLALAGRWGWRSEGIKDAIVASAHQGLIDVLGHVPDQHKASLYRRSAVLAFPSLYEGFGMPPLEAMSLGLPVVASHSSALPEVVGEAGLLIDPSSVDDLHVALKAVLTDADKRAHMSRAGRDRAREFSWDKTANLTLQALENAVR